MPESDCRCHCSCPVETKEVASKILGGGGHNCGFPAESSPVQKYGWHDSHGRKPAVQHLRTFGCVVYVKDVRPQLRKPDDRSSAMVFIGYDKRVKGYCTYEQACPYITCDVIFDEEASWDWMAVQ